MLSQTGSRGSIEDVGGRTRRRGGVGGGESGERAARAAREREGCVCVNILYIACVYTKPTTSDKFNNRKAPLVEMEETRRR